jgi:hypothetical protein
MGVKHGLTIQSSFMRYQVESQHRFCLSITPGRIYKKNLPYRLIPFTK